MLKKNFSIEVNELYKVYDIGTYNLGDFFNYKNNNKRQMVALDNINIRITQGEKIGLIGHNGAGKSTLLKIISRITYPTSGSVVLYGKVGSLLEAGVGFHMELTGIENIYLNGAILGMSRKDIQNHVGKIIEFAELFNFKDTPLKKYSTGMQIKLAFSISVFLKSDILILDEILSVVDQYFQEKCIKQILKSCKDHSRTLIFVSHNLETVKELCEKVIYIKNGRVEMFDDAKKVIDLYQSDLKRH
jgi:lipopolysaccharide transport system ATP-binding protein